MKASDLFIKALEAEGVEYIFGLPGKKTRYS
jgi:thiamine pyrophosphate-dependent acetolactate synthase large subunit-like protein